MRRILSILVLFALLFAPAGMLGDHSAMAMPQQSPPSAGHCSEQQQHDGGEEQQAMIDCAIACTAIPSNQPRALDSELAVAAAPDALPALILHGMRPEAATPPPRFS